MNIGTVLMVIAFVLFVLSFLNVPSKVNLIAGGLALWVLAILLGQGGIKF